MPTAPYVASIMIFAGNFAPRGYALCNGQILPISQNTALFSLIGTFYGGNGTSNFALPNLQGQGPIHQGQGPGLTDRVLGEIGGSYNVTLISTEMPAHIHTINAQATLATASPPNEGSPSTNVWGVSGDRTTKVSLYNTSVAASPMAPNIFGITGGNLPHNNLSPYLALSFCIALTGVFPARN